MQNFSYQEYLIKYNEISKKTWFNENFPELGYSTVKIQSDKNFINDMKNMQTEDKEFVTLNRILNHIKAIPSEKRFNILNKLFYFKNFNNEQKTKIISSCFRLGKGTLFKRSLNLLLSDDILKLLPDQIKLDSFNDLLNNNLSHNIYILKNHLSQEKFNSLIPSLLKSMYESNINSLYCSHILDSLTEQELKNTLNFFKIEIHHKINYERKHHIDVNSKDFISFYKSNFKDDYSLLIDIIIGSQTNISPFLKGIEEIIRPLYLKDKKTESYSYSFLNQMIFHFADKKEDQLKKNSLDKYFQFLSLIPEDLFLENVNNLIGIIYDRKQDFLFNQKNFYFKQKFTELLNSKIINKNFSIEYNENKRYENLMMEYSIKKEQDIILGKLDLSQDAENKKTLKRI